MTENQAKQLIDIVKYLYDCRILHRDIRPENLMIDHKMHIKLIDFGFATPYDPRKNLHVAGVISYAGINFLTYYNSYLSWVNPIVKYEYERTFDIQCAINVIMSLKKADIKSEMDIIKSIESISGKIIKLFQIWINVKEKYRIYAQLLRYINGFDKGPEFLLMKEQIRELF